jgi:Ran GTPase-activating protein (RanGAP) involved in mRNA processing and transport
LYTENYTKSFAEAMAKYVRTSKRLQHIHWKGDSGGDSNCEEILCCFLPAFQDSASLKELDMNLPPIGGPSNLAFERMLAHTRSLQSLTLIFPVGPLEDINVAAALSGLEKNVTLRELTLEFWWGVEWGATTDVSSIFTSLHDHPLLRGLCLRRNAVDLSGLETMLLSDTSKITELDIHKFYGSYGEPMGLPQVLQALARHPKLTKLGFRECYLSRDEARLLRMALCNIPSLQSLVLKDCDLGKNGLTELAPALYHNTSIKELDMSGNHLNDMESAEILQDILRSNKTITTLDLSRNRFGRMTGAVGCIAEGLGNNSTLMDIHLSRCALRDGGVSALVQFIGSRDTTLHKLSLKRNSITSTGIGVLFETMEQNSQITTSAATLFGTREEVSYLGLWEITRCQISHASVFLLAISAMMGS